METKDKKQEENRFTYNSNEGLKKLSKEEVLSIFNKKESKKENTEDKNKQND